MRRSKLDRIDRRILRDLQADGRMTNVDLAERAGISAPPCLRRVRALEEAGYIRGYHAEVMILERRASQRGEKSGGDDDPHGTYRP